MACNFADERGLSLARPVGQRNDRIAPGVMKQILESPRVQRKVLGDDAVTVKHGGHLPDCAQVLCAGRAEPATLLDGEFELFTGHGFLLYTNALDGHKWLRRSADQLLTLEKLR